MFPAASLLSTLLLALSVAATPLVTIRDAPITLPLARKLNLTSAQNLVEHDVARAKALREGAEGAFKDAGGVNEGVTNQAVTYIASVGVGSPATNYNLIIDTGSSNTWIGAGTAYSPTSSSSQTGDSVSVRYGSGSFSGKEYTDTVTLGDLTIKGQSIGVADTAQGFDGVDGILGIGPAGLTVGTLSPSTSKSIPTVTDNAHSLSLIPSNSIGISFNPPSSQNDLNGALTWGGTDSSKFTGQINYVPLTSASPASRYWGIDQTLKYGDTTLLDNSAGIVDTGTTLLLLATDAFNKYKSATGAALDSTTGLLKISSAQYAKLQPLNFIIGGVTYKFTANAQIWPRSLNSAIGGTSGDIYLVVADIGSIAGSGLDFINGFAWLERFYSVYDTDNNRLGFATTPHTEDTSN